jgi:hypothetical protein
VPQRSTPAAVLLVSGLRAIRIGPQAGLKAVSQRCSKLNSNADRWSANDDGCEAMTDGSKIPQTPRQDEQKASTPIKLPAISRSEARATAQIGVPRRNEPAENVRVQPDDQGAGDHRANSESTTLAMEQPKEYRVMGQKGTAARTFNVIDLEQDIATALYDSPPTRTPRHIDFAPPSVRAAALPLPEYLEHREGADEIGRLSAEAVAASYESAAQEIEKMGAELKERAKLCEKLVADSNQALVLIQETAAQFRDAGKMIFLKIEDCSLMTKEVRETCDTLRAKLAGPET